MSMPEPRQHFHDELASLESAVGDMGERAERAIGNALQALATGDERLADQVILDDHPIDDRYLDVERRVLDLLARQTPVASDLRLVSAILHINLHLERVGDMAVNIAKITNVTRNLPRSDSILAALGEMGDVVRPMLRTSMEAFSRRDLDLARRLPSMDDPVDRLNRGMYREVAACAGDQDLLEWAVHMMVVSRQLERVGDHAVDIAEQVAFLLTGEFQEFSDDDG
ncbi:MAG TPA: phosphate signaling complex protein PhoU [Actinomycetota bacterium]|nr:phosphate signaling complex protein PhoU [Actinomycetota bacterium]